MSVVPAALAGAATGSRTFTGLAGLTLGASSRSTGQPDRTLAKSPVAAVITLAALQEWVMDKLPMTPSRLEPAGLGGRVVVAAGCGAIVARRHADAEADPGQHPTAVEVALPAAAAVAATFATAYLGRRWRTYAASRFGRDWVGAVLEDLVSAGFAAAAARS